MSTDDWATSRDSGVSIVSVTDKTREVSEHSGPSLRTHSAPSTGSKKRRPGVEAQTVFQVPFAQYAGNTTFEPTKGRGCLEPWGFVARAASVVVFKDSVGGSPRPCVPRLRPGPWELEP